MSSQKKQFLLFAIAVGLFAALIAMGIAGNVMQGNYKAIPMVIATLGFAVAIIWAGLWFNQNRTMRMFLNPTPNKLIAYYHMTVRRIPNADAAAAYLSALAAAVYGQFDRAREELAAVDWSKTPAMHRGHRLHVLALIALLEKQDKAEALQLTAEAQALEDMPILHNVILVAAGAGDTAAVDYVTRAAKRSASLMPVLCKWALSVHMENTGHPAAAAVWRAKVLEVVPHFTDLAR